MIPELPKPVHDVVDVVAGMPGVEAVLLGGSRVTGTATAASDWDLGVHYRGDLELSRLAELGEVYPPGAWGRLMNGGAWLHAEGIRVDVLLRDLDAVEHWTAEAGHGRFDVDGLLGYLAGIPTYTLTAEVAWSVVVRGSVQVPTGYPDALAEAGVARWRFCRDFSLGHARRAAELGNELTALGQLARAAVEEAHARHCERHVWVLNEKRIFAGTGLPATLTLGPTDPDGVTDVHDLVEQIAEQLVGD